MGIAICEQLGVTRLDTGVVIHTAPESPQPPVLIGYADAAGQWYGALSPEHQLDRQRPISSPPEAPSTWRTARRRSD